MRDVIARALYFAQCYISPARLRVDPAFAPIAAGVTAVAFGDAEVGPPLRWKSGSCPDLNSA